MPEKKNNKEGSVKNGKKIAIVCDWLTNMGGAENVILGLHECFPDAPIYTSVYNPNGVPAFRKLDVRTSFLQKWPWSTTKHKLYPTLRPIAFESLDLREYDVVISSASAEAKGIVTKPYTTHVCYCHTPTRYYWSDYHEYLNRLEFGFLNPLVKMIMPRLVHKLRQWDYLAAKRVDTFVANSENTAGRIKKYYNRDSSVIYPFIYADNFKPHGEKEDFYLLVSRLIPYKKADIAVEACTRLGKKLKVVGKGPELNHLKEIAGDSIEFLGHVSEEEKILLYGAAKAFIFPPEEDFGITPLEAFASGTPVIAYGVGGALETVVEGKTGTFFKEQTVDSLVHALKRFETMSFKTEELLKHAKKFDFEVFKKKIVELVESS